MTYYRRKEVIGKSTLYCADSREVAPHLGPIESIVTDPPFGMAFQSNHRKDRHKEIANDESDDLLLWTCGLPTLHSSYIFCRWDNLATVPKPKSVITWVKDNWSMGDLKHEHGRRTETILFYPGSEHEWVGGRPNDVVESPRSGNKTHPTEKTHHLLSQIQRWTRGVIFDPFMGTGGGGIAASLLGREYVGVEFDEKYFDIACSRIAEWENSIKTDEIF